MRVLTTADGTPRRPLPAATTETEPKVTWGTAASAAAGLILSLLAVFMDSDVAIAGVPDWLVVVLGTLLPGAGTLAAGRSAPHQWRVPPGATGGAQGTGNAPPEVG